MAGRDGVECGENEVRDRSGASFGVQVVRALMALTVAGFGGFGRN